MPRREIVAWAMFDFANSSYTTVIVTVAFGVYFTKLVAPAHLGDWYWGLGMLASNLLAVVASPLIGAMADDGGRKKLFLAATWIACVVSTAALCFVLPGDLALGLGLFVASNLAYSLGE
ncbi:MAG TPA: MFS transporter, partial [Thermoanaerobaculia bacterium]|nr:MFS transporter [Thermoanaerobaculia bacterium]